MLTTAQEKKRTSDTTNEYNDRIIARRPET